MGLMNKLKNILFEEEEVEIPVIDKKTKKVPEKVPVYREIPKNEEIKKPDYNDLFNNLEEIKEPEVKREIEVDKSVSPQVSDREMFNHERTFNFPAFDEEEFDNLTPKPRHSNVLEHEKKKAEKKQEYKAPIKKEEDKVKFRPSPIISPVYGILDKNYTPDEITSRNNSDSARVLDVDSVRKKAFGVMEEVKEEEPIVEEKNIEEKILEEKLEKARTIDELLKDSSDEVIPVNKDVEKEEIPNTDIIEDIEPKHKENLEDDTLENDLFDLIDSMYENREDGE